MTNEILKKVYFVRHGESEHNVAPVFQAPDSPLSENGKRQAERIAERISKIPFDTLISSPFERAKETAEVIEKATGKKMGLSDLFVERIKPTSINGKPYGDEKAEGTFRVWEKSLYDPKIRSEDGENFEDLIIRADKALDFLTKRLEKSLVVVTHGYFLRVIIARILIGESLTGEIHKHFQRSATMENAGITAIRYQKPFESGEEPRWRLWIYNDHAHLG